MFIRYHVQHHNLTLLVKSTTFDFDCRTKRVTIILNVVPNNANNVKSINRKQGVVLAFVLCIFDICIIL